MNDLLEKLNERNTEDVEVDRDQVAKNAQAVREQLTHYEAQLEAIRAEIARGNEWVEQFYVRKTGLKPEIHKLAYAFWEEREQGTPVPPNVLASVHPDIAECLCERKPIPLL